MFLLIAKAKTLTLLEKIKAIHLIFTLCFMKVLLKMLPFHLLLKILNLEENSHEINVEIDDLNSYTSQHLFLEKVARNFPIHFSCLTQCLAFYFLQPSKKQKGISIHLGVAKHKRSLKAHAWISIGQLLLGANDTFQEISQLRAIKR